MTPPPPRPLPAERRADRMAPHRAPRGARGKTFRGTPMIKRICVAACAALLGALCSAGEPATDEKPKTDQAAEKVREGILKFRQEMRSDDEKVRIAALERVMVDKELLEKLVGKDAALVWPKMEEATYSKNIQWSVP